MVRDREASNAAKVLASLILHDLNAKTADAWRSQESMADQAGLSVNTLRRATRELERLGHLQVAVSHGRGVSNRYRPLLKPGEFNPETAPEIPSLVVAFPAENPSPVRGMEPENPSIPSQKPLAGDGLTLRENPKNPPTPHRSDAERFIAAYPISHATESGLRRARELFERLTETGEANAQAVILSATKYAKCRAGRSPDRTKHPENWLKERQWSDTTIRPFAKSGSPVPAEIRAVVVELHGEPAAISYVDPAAWRVADRKIVTARSVAADWFNRNMSFALRALEAAVVYDPPAHAALFAGVV